MKIIFHVLHSLRDVFSFFPFAFRFHSYLHRQSNIARKNCEKGEEITTKKNLTTLETSDNKSMVWLEVAAFFRQKGETESAVRQHIILL